MLGSMASNPRRWHGVQLSIVILLQLVSATSGRTAPSSPHQQAKGIYAAANNGGPVADTATSPDHLSTEQPGKEAVDVQVFDFSFSQSCPYPVVTRAEEDQEQVEQDLQQQSPPAARALSLRECSLGDAGLVEIARSPWVRGRTAARALSLRSNQVRGASSTAKPRSTVQPPADVSNHTCSVLLRTRAVYSPCERLITSAPTAAAAGEQSPDCGVPNSFPIEPAGTAAQCNPLVEPRVVRRFVIGALEQIERSGSLKQRHVSASTTLVQSILKATGQLLARPLPRRRKVSSSHMLLV